MPNDDAFRVGPDWQAPTEAVPATPPVPASSSVPMPGPALPAPSTAPSVTRRTLAGGLALVVAGAAGGAIITRAVWHPTADIASTAAPSTTGRAAVPGVNPFGFSAPNAAGSGTSGDGSAGGAAAGGPTDAAAIAENVDPGIVDINTTLGLGAGEAAGTGMVLTSTGEVLTNNHVISGATSISVTDVGNGKTYPATVVGYDRAHDVAVLQLQGASGLATITSAPNPVKGGAGVVAVGNAGGTGGTPSYAAGVVTDVNQQITASDDSTGTSETLTGLIETNADIQAGDSGGPLVDDQGQVVGMNTAASVGFRFSQTTHGYAIPIATALTIAKQIEAGQASTTVHIGPTAMIGVGVTSRGVDGFGGGTQGGALISQVVSGGPAATAGISGGDTITGLAGTTIGSADDLTTTILTLKPGQKVAVTYVDAGGTPHHTSLTLATGPAQ